MSHRASLFNRFIALAIGLVLLVAGAWAFAWNTGVPFARERVATFDRIRVATLPDESWWSWALLGACVGAFLFGVGVLYVNFTRRHSPSARIHDPETRGILSVDLRRLARSVAQELRDHPGVRHTRGRAIVERGLPTVSVVVTAEPGLDLEHFTARAEAIAARVARCLDGADVATQVLLHLDPPDTPRTI
ncbi:hypothetical protein [Rhodococcus sp. NPDC058521]|uniref:hypothetical protein n=1 Tax=Rhodococcus sp. NPDC058521 TaxID=3346536 RepID=UPI00365A888E